MADGARRGGPEGALGHADEGRGPGREALFGPTRSRTTRSAVGQLPGQSSGTARLERESGPCPEPVRVLHGPFDEQWLIPDHRLIDAARPELWRVADERQVFVMEQTAVPDTSGPVLLVASVLPLSAGRGGRVRPAPAPRGREPNLAPGLLEHLGARLGHSPTPSTSSPGRSRSRGRAVTDAPSRSPRTRRCGRTASGWGAGCCG